MKTFNHIIILVSAMALTTGCLGSGPGNDGPPSTATPDAGNSDEDASQPDAAGKPDLPGTPDAGPPDVPGKPDLPGTPDVLAPQCLDNGNECYEAAECCSGICTYDGNSYVAGSCVAPLPDGSYCEANGWCQSSVCKENVCGGPVCTVNGAACTGDADCCSGSCENGACAAPVCAADGGTCFGGADCCSGLCTYDVASGAYVPGLCIPPQPDGAACEAPEWCASGTCVEGTCGGAQACMGLQDECWSDFDCCDGTFCSYAFDYTAGACSTKQPDGAYCLQASWCDSGNCVNNQCVTAVCQDVGTDCFAASDCCTGLCTYNGEYTPGQCVDMFELGSECLSDSFCASGNCAEGVCATATVTFSDVWEQVILPNDCGNGYCHGGNADGAFGVSFSDQEMAYWTLTQNPSGIDGCNAYTYVVPYQPEQSVLWLRTRPVSEDAGDPCFDKMPAGSDGLDPASAELVKQWILAGAPQ